MRDTGLLVSMLEEGTQKAILDDDLYSNKGALLERQYRTISIIYDYVCINKIVEFLKEFTKIDSV